MTDSPPVADAQADPAAAQAARSDSTTPLRRSRDQKVISGVCGGLGRYCDVDPVIFRVVLAVLAATGGLGLILYGFFWLLVPLLGEDENEGRRLLSGRVEGSSLTAVLCALVGCGLFLSMLNNGSVMSFATMLCGAAVGAGYWSRQRQTESEGGVDAGMAQAVGVAPPETMAPPSHGGPSWWRDPIIKDGTTGPFGAGTGYLWGPDDGAGTPGGRSAAAGRSRKVPGQRSIGGWTFLLAQIACVIGVKASWSTQPLGTTLEIGLSCALAVFGLGLSVSCFYGRTGFGTIVLAVVTSTMLAGAAALPKSITTDWHRATWAPASAAAVHERYQLGGGVGELKLGRLSLHDDQRLSVRAEVGAGRLAVTVPRDVTVKLRIKVGIGELRLSGAQDASSDILAGTTRTTTLDPPGGHAGHGTLELDLRMGAGQVEVIR